MLELKGKYSKAVVFTDDMVMDSEAAAQLFDVLNSKMSEGEVIRIMPDYHIGKSCLIGYTQTFNNKDLIDPDIIGVDLGCGVRSVKIRLKNDLFFKDPKLSDYRIRNVIPVGTEINEKTVIDEKDFKRFLKLRLERARSLWPEMVSYDYGIGEVDRIIDSTLKRIGQDPKVFWKSLGTLGGGNHFLEIGYEEGVHDSAWITVHTGSRNLGIKIHSYWKKVCGKRRIISKKALKEEEKRIRSIYSKNPEKIKQEIDKLQQSEKFFYLPSRFLRGEEVSKYISDLIFAQSYAEYNRMTIIKRVKEATGNISKDLEWIDSVHNYIDPMDKIIRKGSIKANQGETVVIPMNMSFGVLIGVGKGNPEWNYSSPHGSGRLLSRSEARSIITMTDFKESMKNVFSSSIVPECIDESPLAYKSPESIIPLLKDSVDISYTVKPLISIKGC